MTMTRADWKRRYYAPLPANVIRVRVDHRDDELRTVLDKVMNMHSFGQFLYHDVLAHADSVRPFNGKPGWFVKGADEGWFPKPNKPFPLNDVSQALIIYNRHTLGMFDRWAKRTKVPTYGSYLSFLRRHDIPISTVPITDPLTREAMTRHA